MAIINTLGQILDNVTDLAIPGSTTPEGFGTNVVVDFQANVIYEQEVTVKLPPPPIGSTVAKVVIENINTIGTMQSEEEVYFDYIDKCSTKATPNVAFVPRIPDNELQLAYDQCLDLIADLYCSPVTSSLDLPDEETPDPQIISYTSQENNLYPGDSTYLLINLQGLGVFKIYTTADGQNSLITEEPFNLPEEQVVKVEVSIPANAPEEIGQIQYNLLVFNKDEREIQQGLRTLYINVLRRPITPVVIPKKELKSDNNFGDAKKEIYHISQFVAGILERDNTFVIDKNIESYKNDNLVLHSGSYVSRDLFRENNGSFYIMNEQETDLKWARDDGQLPRDKIVYFDPGSILLQNKLRMSETRDTEGFGYFSEQITYGISSELTPQEANTLIRKFIPGIKQNALIDVNYLYHKPYTEKEASAVGQRIFNSSIIKQNPEYNFYNKKYEEIHRDIQENLLPNMYFLSLNRQALEIDDDISIDPDITKVLTLNSLILDAAQPPIDIKMYYDFYVKQAKNINIEDNNFLERIKNLYIPYSFLNTIQQYNNNSEMHPMKIEISFTKPKYSFISKILKNSLLGNKLMFSWLTKFQQNETKVFSNIKEEFTENTKNIFRNNNRYIDITDHSNYTKTNEWTINDNFVFLDNYANFNTIKAQKNNAEATKIRQELLYLLSTKARTYEEILEGKKCYNETLYYRIAKFDGDPATSEPIQNIYFPNDVDKDMFKYIDTQVKYDKQYTYIIYTYDIVFGNEYYSQQTTIVDGVEYINTIKNYPKLFLVENVFDQIEAKVKDRPPIYPFIDIHSYKDIDNQVLFLLQKSSNTIKQKEIIIKDEDREMFQQIRQAQNLSNEDLIEFSGDDIIKKYQIFRLENKPKSYEDFKEAKTIEVDTIIDPKEPEKRSNSISYVDAIIPNKKYYYTFRCIDIHDQISNPTKIYEVEMINENGTVFLLWDIFNVEQQNDKEASKAMKRFLMIKPDFLQESFNIDSVGCDNKEELVQKITTDVLSQQNTSIWNKKYKLRLVSKNTNKVYDINFKFGLETKIIE